MADALPAIPGVQLGNTSAIFSQMITWISYLVMFAVVIGLVMGIYWFLYNKVLRYTIPVTLKFEVGGTIVQKADKIWIKRSGEKWDVKFQKNEKLIADLPSDKVGYLKTAGFKSVKTFEGFVRNNQVAWVIPQPSTSLIMQAHEAQNDKGEIMQVPEQRIELFQILPTNMVESYIHQLSKNKELLTKKKWYQDPALIMYASMIVFFVAIIFIYLICKNLPDLVNSYLVFAKGVAQNCAAVQIR
jgi:hypothetical protein